MSKNNDTQPTSHILRGGSWTYVRGYCRCAARDCFPPFFGDNTVGFRLVGEEKKGKYDE